MSDATLTPLKTGPRRQVRKDIRVSYVLATKDRAPFFEKILVNIREFIDPVDELIVIDGGSTDGTLDLVGRNIDIISTFVSEPDCGEAHALNKGLFRARGRYIKPLTDDDYFYPSAMRHLIALAEAHPKIDAIQCGGEAWEVRAGVPHFLGLRRLPTAVAPTPWAIFSYAYTGLGLIVRRDAIERSGGVCGSYAAVDGDLVCRLIECGCTIRYADINLCRWYLYPHSGVSVAGRRERIRLDEALFALRMGQWHSFIRRRPDEMIAIGGGSLTRETQALFCWMWLCELMMRSPLWPLSLYLVRSVRRGLSYFRSVQAACRRQRHMQSSGSGTAGSSGNPWSGELR